MNKNIKTLLVLSFLLFLLTTTYAQINFYRTWVSFNGGQSEQTGVLFEVKDSSILISNSFKKRDYFNENFTTVDIPINNISIIKTRKKGSFRNRILIGAAAGAIIGVVWAQSRVSGDNEYDDLAITRGWTFWLPRWGWNWCYNWIDQSKISY